MSRRIPRTVPPWALAFVAASTLPALPRTASAQERAAMVRVELDHPGTSLRQVESYFTGQSWWYGQRIVCSAPCQMLVPAGATYEIVGDGVPASSPFELPARDDVLLRVSPGNATVHDMAGVLTVAGAIGLALGAVALIGAASSEHSGTVTGGLVGVGAGAGLLAVGLPLMLTNATTVHFE